MVCGSGCQEARLPPAPLAVVFTSWRGCAGAGTLVSVLWNIPVLCGHASLPVPLRLPSASGSPHLAHDVSQSWNLSVASFFLLPCFYVSPRSSRIASFWTEVSVTPLCPSWRRARAQWSLSSFPLRVCGSRAMWVCGACVCVLRCGYEGVYVW